MQGFLRSLYETRVHAGRLSGSYLSHGELIPEFSWCDGADTVPQLIETELHRKIKREPALGIESGVKFFPEGNELEDVGPRTDVVGELWSFS
jgi:hypothetical protein